MQGGSKFKSEQGSPYQSLEEANLIGGINGGIISYCEVMEKSATALFGFCSLRASGKDHYSVFQYLSTALAWITENEIELRFGQEEIKHTEKNLQWECDYYNHTASSIYT